MSSSRDPHLGMKIHALLHSKGIETPMKTSMIETRIASPQVDELAHNAIMDKFSDILKILGMDLDNDSIQDTPKRLAKMFCDEVFEGMSYSNFPKCTTVENGFRYEEMLSAKSTIMSMCEHHLVTFQGIAHMAYIPKKKVLGLSKFNRIAQFFAARPQVQERLTMQIGEALKYILDTNDIAVVIRAEHMCVKLRGVKDQNSETTTSMMSGKFMEVPALRAEFLALTRS